MANIYRLTPSRRAANRLVRLLLKLGLMPGPTYLLTVPGHRTGRPLSTPVTLVEEGNTRWLVAPYGDVAWVRSARAAGQITLSRGKRSETLPIRELNSREAAPILQRYITRVPITRHYFDAKPDSPLTAFESRSPPPPRLPTGVSTGSGLVFRHLSG
jgi:deazaflavin-dependent oxidoreductase (nitroreductase family)